MASMQEFPNAMRNRLRFYNDRSYDTRVPDPLNFEWNPGATQTIRNVIQFTHHGRNAGNELGLAFEFSILQAGLTVDGVVWIDTEAGNFPTAYLATEPVVKLDEQNEMWVKNNALSIYGDVLEWLKESHG